MGGRGRRLLVSVGLAVGLGIVSVTSAESASAATTVGLWGMNESSTTTKAFDASGNRHHGTVGSEVQTGVKFSGGSGYRFPTWNSSAAAHEVIVPHTSKLDPGPGKYAVTIRMRFARTYSNVLQKGQSGTPGGYWKLVVASGKARCLFRTETGSQVTVTSKTALNNSAWHTIRCGRSGSTVSMIVDGKTQEVRKGLSGSISNTWEVAIGGKSRCDGVKVGCDFFAGDVDYVRIEKG